MQLTGSLEYHEQELLADALWRLARKASSKITRSLFPNTKRGEEFLEVNSATYRQGMRDFLIGMNCKLVHRR